MRLNDGGSGNANKVIQKNIRDRIQHRIGDSMLYTIEDISEKDFAEATAMCLRGEEQSLTRALCKVLSKKHGREYVFGKPDVYCFVPKEYAK